MNAVYFLINLLVGLGGAKALGLLNDNASFLVCIAIAAASTWMVLALTKPTTR